MMGGFLSRVLLLAFGYAYPAYECYKTVELNKPEIEQLIFWCQYWILVALLTVLERFGDFAVSWLPLYSEAKLMFFIYLWYPKTKGTTYVYGTFFRPYISQHENDIDRNLLELRARAGDMLVLYWQKAATVGQSAVFDIMKYVAAQSPSQVSRPHPSQPEQQQQPQQKQQQQVQKQPPTLRRGASIAPRQAAIIQQSQDNQSAPSSPKIKRLASAKSGIVASTKSVTVVSTTKPLETTRNSAVTPAVEKASTPTDNANASSSEPSAPPLPEAEGVDDMVVDDGDVEVAIEDLEEIEPTPEERPMEEAIRVTRARLRRRVAPDTAAAAAAPAPVDGPVGN